jgi:hypothetical protein
MSADLRRRDDGASRRQRRRISAMIHPSVAMERASDECVAPLTPGLRVELDPDVQREGDLQGAVGDEDHPLPSRESGAVNRRCAMADHAALPGNVAVAADIAGREVASVVNVTQIATIDRTALEDRLCDIPDWLLAQVDAGLTRTLALTHT